MYPTNHYMDPYSSYYRHHAPYPYYPPPGWEARSQQMPEADSSCRPPYGHCPYTGSKNHSGLPESHSCCSHTYPPPGYYSFRPPFPQELPPPPYPYYHGPFPPHHPNPYSPSYFGPLPPYPVDQTPYNGYDDKFKSHCCGCPNHVCHGDGEQKSNVKIEEHMPEVKPESNQKGADSNSRMIRNPNYQYPVMWLPSRDMKDKGDGRRSFEFPPQLFSKWFPQNGERAEDVKPADDSQKAAKQLQWPIVWMPPGYDETKQQAKKEPKEIEQSPKNTQEDPPSPKIKIIPLSWFGNDHHDQKPAARDGSGEQNGTSSAAENPAAGTEHRHDTTADGNCKTIPVVAEKPTNWNEPAISVVAEKATNWNEPSISVVAEKPTNGNAPAISVLQEKPNSGDKPAISVLPEKHDAERKVHTCRTIPVMPQKESDEKKSYMAANKEEKKAIVVQKEGENKKSNNVESSKAKPSKLPPVCLRVDPLPKRKSGNTSSRSSSPATKNVCEKGKDVKEAQGKNQETKLSEHQKECKMPIKEKSSDEIAKNTGGPRNVTVLDGSVKHAQEEQVSTSMTDQKVHPTVSAEAQENASARSLQECDKNRKEDGLKIQGEARNLACEIKLSEPDAAVRIQSAYRGYHVRRWQPLEKLRKIKNVNKQMQDVEKQIQALEASSEQLTEKEHVAINETIMNLLLNLDTIQNLHPVVREPRKSVARQLVCLKEKLDTLCKKLPAEPTNHPKSEEVSLTGVGEEQFPSSINSNEPMRDELSSEVSLKLSQDGACTEQKHQMEESSTAKEEAQDEGKAAAATECQGVALMDEMCDEVSSAHITKKHQMEERDVSSAHILREECTEEEKAPVKGEVSSTDYTEPLHYSTPVPDGSALKQCTPSAEQNCHTEESDHGVSPATTEDDAAAMATACMESEVGVGKDGSVEGGGQVQESTVDSSWPKHDAAPAEDECKEASAKFLHMEDSSVSSEVANAHGNDPAHADESVEANPGGQQEEAVTTLVVGKEPDGTLTSPVCDTGNMDGVTCANSENTEEENDVSVGSETAKQREVSGNGKDDSTLVDQQNEIRVEDPAGGSAIAEEPEAVPSEIDGKTVENSLNDAIGEEPEAVPLETEGKTMENTTVNDAIGEEPEAVPVESTLNGNATMPAGTLACATAANSAAPVPEAGKPEEGSVGAPPEEEEATATAPGRHDNGDDERNKGVADEKEQLKEMVQKLLASGNEQIGVIAELSNKVKSLERKLAVHKRRRPKVRVVQHRPARANDVRR